MTGPAGAVPRPDPAVVAADPTVILPATVPDPDRFVAAIAAIDAANADDPATLVIAGVARPKELTHARLATAWVARLDPAADETQLLAARAHHLRRWATPRSSYPEGRAGYLRWRAERKKQHAADVAAILATTGYDDAVAARVGAIIRKEGLGRDPAVQTHEDALCLVFVQTQFDELLEQLGTEHMVEVVAKTIAKMSPAALAIVPDLDLSDGALEVIGAAMASRSA